MRGLDHHDVVRGGSSADTLIDDNGFDDLTLDGDSGRDSRGVAGADIAISCEVLTLPGRNR